MESLKQEQWESVLRSSDVNISESRYKMYKNKLTSILRSTENFGEKAYYIQLLAEKRGDIKEIWAILNAAICKQRPSIKYPIHIKCGDK